MVTNLFYPLNGGSEHVVYETSRVLVKRGYEVHVLTEKTISNWPLYECIEGIHIHRCPVHFANPVVRFVSGVLNASKLFRTLNAAHSFEVLHFHLTLSSVGVLLCRNSRQSARISSFYGPWHQEQLVEKEVQSRLHPGRIKAFLFHRLQRFVLNHSEKIIVLSRFSQFSLSELFGPSLTSELIPGAADLARFLPAGDRRQVRARLGLPVAGKVLLTIRRLVPRMGIDALIAAMPRILTAHAGTLLVVGGTGVLRETLEKQAIDLGVSDQVLFTGYIPDEELPLYYQAADLFVLPTRALEGFGLSTVESLACGTPVVGTAVGATAEIITGLDDRFLIPESTPESIANTILTCIDTACEDAFRRRCRRYAEEHYDWERVVDSLEQVYRSVCDVPQCTGGAGGLGS